jgi:peroxiredoxin
MVEIKDEAFIKPVPNSQINRGGLPIGTLAPTFELPSIHGDIVRLPDSRGSQTLIVFSDPECGPCTEVAKALQLVHEQTPDLRIVFVSRGDTAANREKALLLNLTFEILLQRKWEISKEYGIFATPVGYLIDKNGFIAADVAVGVVAILALAKKGALPDLGATERTFEGYLQSRLDSLKNEEAKGQKELIELERRKSYLVETTLRIRGAIQALDESLAYVRAGSQQQNSAT